MHWMNLSIARLRNLGYLASITSLSLFLVTAVLACRSDDDGSPTPLPSPTPRTVFVNATRVPTVTPSPTPVNPRPTATPTVAATVTATPTPTLLPTVTLTSAPITDESTTEVKSTLGPGPTATAVAEREAYCREHALPTSTPEPDVTPTVVPTSPPGIADDEVPDEWAAKMDAIESWVRELYEVDEESVGEFNRRFVREDVWKEWRADAVEEWANDEDSTIHLWEQINRTLTLLSTDGDFVEFTADYQGESYIGLYNPIKREIFIRADLDEFDVGAELTYVHEYAHHVQNVKYDFVPWRECFEGDSDAYRAITAFIEGDASNTEYAYIEDVIGWERIYEYIDNLDDESSRVEDEPVMRRYRDELNNFTYLVGTAFVFKIPIHSDCVTCATDRQKIDEVFSRPPFATEQIYDESKYFNHEARDEISLPDDVLGERWELRYNSTVGRSDWTTMLAALSDVEADLTEHVIPELRGDSGMLFEDHEQRALHLQVAEWETDLYIERLVSTFDDIPRLERLEVAQTTDQAWFDDLYVWDGDTGAIALGVQIEPVDRFYFMFMAVGPDVESARAAVVAARDQVSLFGEQPFRAISGFR